MQVEWNRAMENLSIAAATWDADEIGTDENMRVLGAAEVAMVLCPAPDVDALAYKVRTAIADGRILPADWRAAILKDIDALSG